MLPFRVALELYRCTFRESRALVYNPLMVALRYRSRPARVSAGLFLALALTACRSTPVELSKQLTVTDVTTGWFDAGVVEGNKNKLVPTISFRLKNQGPGEIGSV